MRRNAPAPTDFSALPRPGRIYAWGSQALAFTNRRWFLLFTRDALLFLALSLAMLALDNPRAIWRLWWPMPLALTAGAITLVLHGVSPVRWRHLVNLGLFALPLAGRVWLSLHGPVPVAGLHEARELALILVLGCTLWLAGSCHPARALGVWLGAVLVGGAGLWMVYDRDACIYPFRIFIFFTLGWGVLAALRLAAGKRQATPAEAPTTQAGRFITRVKVATVDLFCLGFLALGLLAGHWLTERQLAGPLRTALAIHNGMNAQRELWLQSILFGWGGPLLERLAQVVGEPARMIAPPWGGLGGTLARGGIAGLGVLLVWSLALNRQVRRIAGAPYSQALGFPAALAVFMLLGMSILGAPRPSLASFMFGGWLGLALIKPVGRRGIATPGPGAALATGAILFALTVALAFPTLGQALAARAGRLTPYRMQQTLQTARQFDPFDPAIPAGLAASYRKQAALGDSGTEVSFIRVVRFYQEAQRLDPYDTGYPLELANFQLQNDRQEEAIHTIREALAHRPRAQELLVWLFGTALRLNQNALADGALAQALALDPMDGTWWWQQYMLARRLGQGPLAARALAVALTGGLEHHAPWVNAAWEAMHDGSGAAIQ